MNLKTPPPDKLSDLIDLAAADAQGLDRGVYTPSSWTWHRPSEGECLVCLAGAVIAGTLRCTPETDIDVAIEPIVNLDGAGTEITTITDERWRRALWTLDSAREGNWTAAVETLHGDSRLHGPLADEVDALNAPLHPEFDDWRTFELHLASLAKLASDLRALGL